MREVNEAWHVLRDPARRLAYDRDLGIDHGPRWAAPEPHIGEYGIPLDDQVDEPVARPTRAGDLLTLVAPGLLAVAVACFALGAMMLNAPLLAAGFGLLVLSGAAFVVTPFLVLARDRRYRR